MVENRNISFGGIHSIGIYGGGKMGISFFNYILKYQFNIIFYMRDSQKLEQAKQSYMKYLSGRGTETSAVVFTNKVEDLGPVDIIFEFASEDLRLKREIISRLISKRQNPIQIIATGSSSLIPSKIFTSYHIYNIVGVHFIYPIQYIKAVEVICGNRLSQNTTLKVKEFLLSINKKPVILNEDAGVITTKILINFQNEAFNIFDQCKLSPHMIDAVVEDEQYAIPPFKMTDGVGFDVTLSSIIGHFKGSSEIERFSNFKSFLEENIVQGVLGRKNGKGFFNQYRENNDSGLDEFTKKKISDRLRMIYIKASFDLLNECQVDSKELDDILSEVNQSDIGPVTLALKYGLENVLKTLERSTILYGAYFTPPDIMQYAVQYRIGRDEIDRQIRLFKMGGVRPDWCDKAFR